MVVAYSGKPGEIKQGDVQPWLATDGEWTVAGEPESSAWWYPANDHPSDPALMDVSIRVPAGMEAISVGRLESADAGNEKNFDTWHWIARQPMATYLNFMTIGQLRAEAGRRSWPARTSTRCLRSCPPSSGRWPSPRC